MDNSPMIAVWTSMAEHFLDTETRAEIPRTALACVHAGLSPEESHAVWLHEVSPVVAGNLLCVAGEWAGWDEDWLVAEVGKRAQRRRERHSGLSRVLARCRIDLNRGVWQSIERGMRVIIAAEPEQRQTLAADLALLSVHYFDMSSSPLDAEPVQLARLRALCVTAFDVLDSATLGGERAAARDRVSRALTERGGR